MTKYYLLDAKSKPLGRMATKIAELLRGKNSVDFKPNVNPHNIVIIINASSVFLSGQKNLSKQYFRHSGYPGGIKVKQFNDLKKESPEEIIKHAVRGMIPSNRMRDKIMKNLKIFHDNKHLYKTENIIIES